MYRALKERNDKRWFFERIFNRKQYIAERDSLKALTGLMMSLTGETKEDINKVLAEYKNAMNDSGRTSEERKAEAARIKKVAKENGPQIIQYYSIHDIEKKPIHNEEIKDVIVYSDEVVYMEIYVEQWMEMYWGSDEPEVIPTDAHVYFVYINDRWLVGGIQY
jgi:hypothetical protein